MDDASNYLEGLWSNLLSQQPETIRSAFASLDSSSRKTVITHLQRMAKDPGWQPEQRASARDALRALKNQINQEE